MADTSMAAFSKWRLEQQKQNPHGVGGTAQNSTGAPDYAAFAKAVGSDTTPLTPSTNTGYDPAHASNAGVGPAYVPPNGYAEADAGRQRQRAAAPAPGAGILPGEPTPGTSPSLEGLAGDGSGGGGGGAPGANGSSSLAGLGAAISQSSSSAPPTLHEAGASAPYLYRAGLGQRSPPSLQALLTNLRY